MKIMMINYEYDWLQDKSSPERKDCVYEEKQELASWNIVFECGFIADNGIRFDIRR